MTSKSFSCKVPTNANTTEWASLDFVHQDRATSIEITSWCRNNVVDGEWAFISESKRTTLWFKNDQDAVATRLKFAGLKLWKDVVKDSTAGRRILVGVNCTTVTL